MTSLTFANNLATGNFEVLESMSGAVFTALGEVNISLPSSGQGAYTFVCSNSTEESPVSITINAPIDGTIIGGDQTTSAIQMYDYSVVTLSGNNGQYRVFSGYGNVAS